MIFKWKFKKSFQSVLSDTTNISIGALKMEVDLDKNVFVPGETLPIKVKTGVSNKIIEEFCLQKMYSKTCGFLCMFVIRG